MEFWPLVAVVVGVVSPVAGVVWHVHKRLTDMAEWRTRKDLADEQHAKEIELIHGRFTKRDTDVKELGEMIASVNAGLAQNAARMQAQHEETLRRFDRLEAQ